MSVSKEGIPYIALALAASVIMVNYHSMGALVPLALAAYLVFFFRDPRRVPTADESAVIAPADGRIVRIDEVSEGEYLAAPARRMSIFMSIFDVHVNYVPVTGVVDYVYYRKGSFKNALQDISSRVNENNTVGIKSRSGALMVRQIAGMIARRIVCRCCVGDRVEAGQKLGMIKFGSRVDLFLPLEARLLVKKGDRVRGGETVIARLA